MKTTMTKMTNIMVRVANNINSDMILRGNISIRILIDCSTKLLGSKDADEANATDDTNDNDEANDTDDTNDDDEANDTDDANDDDDTDDNDNNDVKNDNRDDDDDKDDYDHDKSGNGHQQLCDPEKKHMPWIFGFPVILIPRAFPCST